MTSAKFLVCERTGDWAVACRRVLQGHATGVQETRSLPECYAALAAQPRSVLAVEEGLAAPEALAAWLADVHIQFPRARLLILAHPAGGECEWLAREAGVVQVLRSRMELPVAAVWIAAHLAEGQPDPAAGTLRQRLLARLPWPRFATDALNQQPEPESK